MKKIFTVLLIALTLFSVTAVFSLAAESEADALTAKNLFASIYEEIIRHSDKIFSALAFLGSLLIALAYKKGLLPLIRGSLNTLANAVTKLNEESESANAAAKKSINEATDVLARTQDKLSELCADIAAIETELQKANAESAKSTVVKRIMEAQIDMLYEIFMSSSIPLYQKEAVGEKISAMKKELASYSEENDE
jgi:chromosome segregation ATPase